MTTYWWLLTVLVVAGAALEVGYRNGRRAGIRMVGSALRGALGDMFWGGTATTTSSTTSFAVPDFTAEHLGPREADSGWRENDDYRRTHEALSPEARRAMGFSGEG